MECLSEKNLHWQTGEESTTADKSHYWPRSFVRKIARIPPIFARFDLASRMTVIIIIGDLIKTEK